jgi:hypothetical protein
MSERAYREMFEPKKPKPKPVNKGRLQLSLEAAFMPEPISTLAGAALKVMDAAIDKARESSSK